MKTRRHVVSIVLVLLFSAGLIGSALVLDLEPRLGLDLRGGLSVTLTAPEGTNPDVLVKTVEILRGRIDQVGVAEPEISQEGTNNILIQLPGTDDPSRLLRLIGRTAQLQFRQVQRMIPTGSPEFASATVTDSDDPAIEGIFASEDENTKFQLSKAELTGEVVRDADAVLDDQTGAWGVSVDFTSRGDKAWEGFTGRLACLQGEQRQIAIVLDGKVESSPEVSQEVKCQEGIVGGTTAITGSFSEQEAKDLALVLKTGALPVKLEQSEVRTVSPTLGGDALRAGLYAGALGLGLVLLYVLVYYRTLGLQTWIGLFVFSAIIYGLVLVFGKLVGWSLTLSGIAGLIVSVGIATDSYIVFFERVKEEVHEGRSLASSIDKGFQHAWRTMRTANMVTILAAVVLYFLAVGSVRGFALALGMATLLDLGITYAFTWPIAALLSRSHFFAENPVLGMRRALEGRSDKQGLLRKIYRSEFNIDFIGKRKTWFILSGFLILVSGLAIVPGIRGLTYGIDFRGGTVYRAPVSSNVTVESIREAMQDAGVSSPVIQIVTDPVSDRSQVQVQTEPTEDPDERAAVVQALGKAVGSSNPDREVDFEQVGEKWGQQVTTKALRGLVIFLIAVIIYMSVRLEPKMALAGIIALIHDLLITIGIYAIVGFEVTPATVIATLTILGYSLYDTVVVFDKIRENQALASNARKSFAQIANDSSNQVLMRSINTSLTVLLPVGSLLFVGSALLGADTLKDLALALFVGIAAGAYSSVFLATPLLSVWKQREPRYAGIKERVLREELATETASQAKGSPSVSKGSPRTQTVARPQAKRKQSRAQRKKGRR